MPLPWHELFPTLDLHGLTAEEARRRAERWLRERAAEGERTVRIVTGRGNRSVGPPVLRGEIQALLGEMRKLVRDWTMEAGGGAVRVELRRGGRGAARTAGAPPAPRPGAVPPPLPADPELRRAAEESLADLGVTPTPELLEAEMRRLRGE
jgi:hypothetical protein